MIGINQLSFLLAHTRVAQTSSFRRMDRATAFFNRSHLVQGAQILATIFCLLGTIFIGLDRIGIGSVRPTTFTWDWCGRPRCLHLQLWRPVALDWVQCHFWWGW